MKNCILHHMITSMGVIFLSTFIVVSVQAAQQNRPVCPNNKPATVDKDRKTVSGKLTWTCAPAPTKPIKAKAHGAKR